MRKVLKLPKGSQQYKEIVKIQELIEAQDNTVGNASIRAQADVKTVKEVIQAKRGSLKQCDKFVSKIPPP